MQRDTGLRTSADASFLVHGLLDLSPLTRLSPCLVWTDGFSYPSLVVDSALEIIDAYQRKIIELEQQILLKPKMKAVRQREGFPSSLGSGVP